MFINFLHDLILSPSHVIALWFPEINMHNNNEYLWLGTYYDDELQQLLAYKDVHTE